MVGELLAKALVGEVLKRAPKFIRQRLKEKRFAFISDHHKKAKYLGFHKVILPMINGTLTTETERDDSISELKKLKFEELGARRSTVVIVQQDSLPLAAGFVIGYTLHTNGGNKLIFEKDGLSYKNTSPRTAEILMEQTDERKCHEKAIDLCFYIQAKSADTGSPAFYDYIKKTTDLNPYIVSLVGTADYDESINLEKTAKKITSLMTDFYGKLEKESSKKVSVHLFYNGNWGLALLLGNQISPVIPVQLYDYSNTEGVYGKSFCLHGDLFK